MQVFFYTIIFLFLNCFSYATELCEQSSILSVRAPVFYKHPEKGYYNYKYQYIEKGEINETDPTIIILPGGPGGTSISQELYSPYFDFIQILWGLPNNYKVILTDPRTCGCNSETDGIIPDEALTTVELASDIIEIIKKHNLKNYIIHGHSYGTVLATTLSSLIQEANMIAPKAILLSGTLGHAFRNQEERLKVVERAWYNLFTQLPLDIQNKFEDFIKSDSQNWKLLGLPKEAWENFIVDGLTEGVSYVGGKRTFVLYDKLLKLNQEKKFIEELKHEVSNYCNFEKPYNRLHDIIFCQEISSADEDCKKLLVPINFYDSVNYQINSPIIYVHGSFDPAVDIEHAYYHYRNQQNSTIKYFIEVKEAGHTNLFPIGNSACSDKFWATIFQGKFDIEHALFECSNYLLLRFNI